MRDVSDALRLREVLRQQQLLDAVFDVDSATPDDAAPGWQRAVAAYRAHAAAHASEVLRARYPTLVAMLGDRTFDALAVAHWREDPPTQGDLARFGDAFPDWLQRRAELASWPWLGDCARLEQALWQVRFAPPAALTDADLQRLATHDPGTLVLRLARCTRLLECDWAVVQLRQLHAAAAPDVDAIAAALRAGPQAVWIWRQGFDAHCMALDAHALRWLRALRDAPTLGDALARSDDDFDVAAWLGDAVRAGWIDAVELSPPMPARAPDGFR